MGNSVKDRFYDLVKDRFYPQREIQESHNLLNDYGGDSLDTINLLDDVDNEFDIDSPNAREETLHTIGDWLAYIKQKLDEKAT